MSESQAATAPVAFGPFLLDAAAARLTRDGDALELAPRPLALLEHLARHPGELITKDALLDAVWGHRHVSESVLKGTINTLRKALGDEAQAPQCIETVPRRGYRFIAAVRLAPAHGTAGLATSQLPRLPAPLLGREAEQQAVCTLLDEHRLVTLAGTGGVGKTHLALAVGAERAGRERDGIWFVALDALPDGLALVATLARALRLSAEAARSAETLAAALAPQQLLLLLDNCEHLLDAVAPLVQQLLSRAAGLRVLATSQEPLHLAGEQVLRIAPLACPPIDGSEPAADIARYPAVSLFVRSVRSLDAAFALDEHNRDAVAALCGALDGLPLALELAAARVPLLGIDGVRARLSERLALLTRGARDAPARQRTLLATLEWSHGLLSSPQAVVLRRLAVFAGTFSLSAAQEVVADADLAEWEVMEAIDALQDKSMLVTVAAGSGAPLRLRLYDSIRSFALEHLEAADETALMRRRHAQWLGTLLAEASHHVNSLPSLVWTAQLQPETDNLRSALRHAVAGGDGATAVALFAHAAVFWHRAGLKHEAAGWLEAVRGFVTTDLPDALRADFLQAEAYLCVFAMIGAPAAVDVAVNQAIVLHHAAGDAVAEYFDLFLSAQLGQRLRYGEDSSPLRQRMQALEAPGWNVLQRRLARWVRGNRLRELDDNEGFRRFCSEEIAHHRGAGDTHGAWIATQGLALAEHDCGRLDEAIPLLDRAVQEIEEAGALRQYPALVGLHACMLLQQGHAATLPLVRRAVQLLRVDGTLWCMAGALPFAAMARGDAVAAARVLGWADETVARLGETPGPFFARLRVACEAQLQPALPGGAFELRHREGAALDEASALRLALGPEPL